MQNELKSGDTVYSLSGQKGIFVAEARGGGFIVQTIYSEEDAEDDENTFVDGVELWRSASKTPPSAVHDELIGEKLAELAKLQKQIQEARATKAEFDREHAALKERLAVHESLRALDDLSEGRITHYVVDQSENGNGDWVLLSSPEFFKQRNIYYTATLTLWTQVSTSSPQVTWKFSKGTDGRAPEHQVHVFANEADARAKQVSLVQAGLLDAVKRYGNNSYWLGQLVCQAIKKSVEIPASVAERLASLKQQEAEAELAKAQKELTNAQAKIDALR